MKKIGILLLVVLSFASAPPAHAARWLLYSSTASINCSSFENGGKLTSAGGDFYCSNDQTGSGVSVYPATATVRANFGINAATATIGSLNGVLKASSGNVSGSATTSDLTEGSNLYFTTGRATAAISGTSPITFSAGVVAIDKSSVTLLGSAPTTSVIAEGSNQYFTVGRATGAISATAPITFAAGVVAIDKSSVTLLGSAPTTSAIAEGSNQYFTVGRATAAMSATSPMSVSGGVVAIDKSSVTLLGSAPTTSSIAEGSRLYFTTARATAAISGTSPITFAAGAIGLDTSGIVLTTGDQTVAGKKAHTGLLSDTASFYTTGRSVPASGAGIEIYYSGGGGMLSFDRDGGVYSSYTVDASTVDILSSGANGIQINGTNFVMRVPPKFSGTNTTGAGSAALGSNSPATTNTAPYTWIRAVSSDGSTVYIPCWK